MRTLPQLHRHQLPLDNDHVIVDAVRFCEIRPLALRGNCCAKAPRTDGISFRQLSWLSWRYWWHRFCWYMCSLLFINWIFEFGGRWQRRFQRTTSTKTTIETIMTTTTTTSTTSSIKGVGNLKGFLDFTLATTTTTICVCFLDSNSKNNNNKYYIIFCG